MVWVGPQKTEVDVLVYMWDGKILRLLANTALYLKQHKIGIQLLWRTYRKSWAVYRTVTLPMTLSDS